MDPKPLARFAIILIGLAICLATLPPAPAAAQNGVCPQYTMSLGDIGGTWPSSARICRPIDAGDVRYQTGPALAPCGHRVMVWRGGYFSPSLRSSGYIYIVPPVYPDTDRLRLRFYNFPQDLWSIPVIYSIEWSLVINSYNAAGFQLETRTINPQHAHAQILLYTSGAVPYEVMIVDTHIATAPGGWIRIELLLDEPNTGAVYGYSGIQIGPYANYSQFPDMCPLPDGNPATPTPNWTSTPTPTGTYVPPIAPTPWPTAPHGTPQPTMPPPAPIIFPTAPSEPTPTPWRSYSMAPIQFPNINYPAVPTRLNMGLPTPGSSGPMPTAVSADGSDAATRIWQIVYDWQETADTAAGLTDVYTNTSGLGAPAEMAQVVTHKISEPVSYAKSLLLYLPNFGPMLAAILIMVGWVLTNIMAKPMIGIAKVFFELIRRLWEAIPLN